MEINKDNLEKALNSSSNKQEFSKEMEIGFHNGALNTLVAEKNELLKLVQNVDNLIVMHIQRLEQLGVKLSKQNNSN